MGGIRRPRRARQVAATELGGTTPPVLRVPAEVTSLPKGRVVAGSAQRAEYARQLAVKLAAEDARAQAAAAAARDATGEAGESVREALRLRAERRERDAELRREVPPHWGTH